MIKEIYETESVEILSKILPNIPKSSIRRGVKRIAEAKFQDTPIKLVNEYKNKTMDNTLANTLEYIIKREPIITAYGVMFKKSEDEENLLIDYTVDKFLNQRTEYKNEMFTYEKGSDLFKKFNLLQLLSKIDANGFYGATGNSNCLFYNLHVAASTTLSGRSAISTAGMAFEAFLANNVKFRALNEITQFINNVWNEKQTMKSSEILDRDIPMAMVFEKLISTCGHGYIPSDKDMEIVWRMLLTASQEVLNRLFYKNNLFAFIENKVVEDVFLSLLSLLNDPFCDPNHVPVEIESELEVFWDMINEFVFYNYQYIDRIDRLSFLPRKVTAVIDTDSNLVILDPWFNHWRNKLLTRPDIDLKISNKRYKGALAKELNQCETEEIDKELDFDLDSDMIIESKKLKETSELIPEDGVRYSIINILAFCLSKMVNLTMIDYSKHNNTYIEGKDCRLYMKNEFLFKRLLMAMVKKNYASIIELQEGNMIPQTMEKSLDIKGLPLSKSSVGDATRDKLTKILYEDILKSSEISPIKIIKKLMIVEKEIYNSLANGNREFYKPVSVKGISAYDNPLRIQGIKASLIWNALKDDDMETIDTTIKNGLDIVKINLNPKIAEEVLKDKYPKVYARAIELFNSNKTYLKITSIALPPDQKKIPEWLMELIDYNTIITNNLVNFSQILNSLQCKMTSTNKNVNYTNIMSL